MSETMTPDTCARRPAQGLHPASAPDSAPDSAQSGAMDAAPQTAMAPGRAKTADTAPDTAPDSAPDSETASVPDTSAVSQAAQKAATDTATDAARTPGTAPVAPEKPVQQPVQRASTSSKTSNRAGSGKAGTKTARSATSGTVAKTAATRAAGASVRTTTARKTATQTARQTATLTARRTARQAEQLADGLAGLAAAAQAAALQAPGYETGHETGHGTDTVCGPASGPAHGTDAAQPTLQPAAQPAPRPGTQPLCLQLQDVRGRTVQLVCNLLWEAGTLVSGAGSALRLTVPWQESVPVSRQTMARTARSLGCDRLVLTGSRYGMLHSAGLQTVRLAVDNLGSRQRRQRKPLSLAALALRTGLAAAQCRTGQQPGMQPEQVPGQVSDPASGTQPGQTARGAQTLSSQNARDDRNVRDDQGDQDARDDHDAQGSQDAQDAAGTQAASGTVCILTLPVRGASPLYWVWAARGNCLSARADRVFGQLAHARLLASSIAESLGAPGVRTYDAHTSCALLAYCVRRADRSAVRSAQLLPLEPVSPARLVLAGMGILLAAALLIGGQTMWEWWETRARTTLLSQTRGELAKKRADIVRNPCKYFDISWQTKPEASLFVREVVPDMLAFPLAGNGWMLTELTGTAASLTARWKALPASILLYPPGGAVNEDKHPEYARQTVTRKKGLLRQAANTRKTAMQDLLAEHELRRLLAELATRFSLRLRLRFARPEAIMVGETRVEAPWVKGSVALEAMPDALVHDAPALARVLDIPGLALTSITWDGRQWKAAGDMVVLRDAYAKKAKGKAARAAGSS